MHVPVKLLPQPLTPLPLPRTPAQVYDALMREGDHADELLVRLQRFAECGTWAGKIWCVIAVLQAMWLALLRWWRPDSSIELAVDWPS